MKCTSSEANKLLRTLEAKRNSIQQREVKAASFVISVGENIEEVRPEYDFRKTQDEIAELNKKIRTVKHAINRFNVSHSVPGFDMTIDQVLVYLPQLSERVNKLKSMADTLPRERVESFRMNTAEYSIANYDPKEVEGEYNKAQEELHALQLALDVINSSETMDIDIVIY